MANRRSNAIERIRARVRTPHRALDQLSDETLFHLADLHDRAVRPQPAPRRRRWHSIGILAASAIVIFAVSSLEWAYFDEKRRAHQARLTALETKMNNAAAGIGEMIEVLRTQEVPNPTEHAEIIKELIRLFAEAKE